MLAELLERFRLGYTSDEFAIHSEIERLNRQAERRKLRRDIEEYRYQLEDELHEMNTYRAQKQDELNQIAETTTTMDYMDAMADSFAGGNTEGQGML